jgi:hypothetical protein
MVVAQTQWQSQGQASGKPGDALHRLLMEAGWSYAQISALAGPRRVEGQAEAARAWRNDEHGAARSSNFKFSRTEWSGLFRGGNSGGEER